MHPQETQEMKNWYSDPPQQQQQQHEVDTRKENSCSTTHEAGNLHMP
jgi:hypothetical protein